MNGYCIANGKRLMGVNWKNVYSSSQLFSNYCIIIIALLVIWESTRRPLKYSKGSTGLLNKSWQCCDIRHMCLLEICQNILKHHCMVVTSISPNPFECVTMDILRLQPTTPKGNRYVLIIADYYKIDWSTSDKRFESFQSSPCFL